MTNVIIISAAALIIIVIIIAVVMYMAQGSGRKSLISSDIWNDFVKRLQTMKSEGKKIGLMVSTDKKLEPIGEKIDTLLLPAFEFAVDSIYRSEVIHHLSINTNKNSLPPNCHVFVVFKVELDGKHYLIKPTYHTTNVTGTLTREPLRFRPDVMKLTTDDLKKYSKRDSLCNIFRQEFPGFIAAVARKG